MAVRDRQLEVVAGIRLVDARVADRAVVVLAHRVRVVADRRGDDVDALRVAVELRRREVGRERDDVAEVLGRRDDVDPLVRRDRHDPVVDQVLAAADHDVAVRLERLLERRRVVALDPVDDGRLVDARVDLAGGLDPGLAVQPELLLADREDRVGVEAVERPERDELVVALAAERPVVVAVGERLLEPRGVARRTRAARCPRPRSGGVARRPGGPCPRRRSRRGTRAGRRPTRSRAAATAGPGGPSPASSSRRGSRGSPRAGRRAARAAPEAARSPGRRSGTARRRSCRARSSAAPRSGLSRCRRSSAAGCGSRGRARAGPAARGPPARSPRPPRGGPSRRPARRAARRAMPSPRRSSSVWMPTYVPSTGLSRTSRRKRVSTRS